MEVFVSYKENFFELTSERRLTIGREGYQADVELKGSNISRKHAQIIRIKDKVFIKDTESLLGVFVNTKRIATNIEVELNEGDVISIVNHNITITFSKVNTEIKSPKVISIKEPSLLEQLQKKKRLTIGRNPENDIIIKDQTVSRFHAQITLENNAFYIEDLNSKNGVYYKGKKITKKEAFKETEAFIISLTSIHLLKGVEDLRKNKSAISAKQISKVYENGGGLQPVSLKVVEGDFVALIGPSGCGKSTLLKSLSNVAPPYKGEVKIHGLDIKTHFNLLKTKIGYVPQDDIVHEDLSIYYTLYYAAKLRLPYDTTEEEIQHKIDEVLISLNLENTEKFKQTLIKNLSGGQRKRISIAVELLTDPTILFLDEPTSPLDPETIDSFLGSIKKLTEKGTTILMVTHKPEDLSYSDKVIFFMIKGYVAYYGSPDKIYEHFGVDDIIKVYALLSDKRLLKENINSYYIKVNDGKENIGVIDDLLVKKEKSGFSQWLWLTKRYHRVKVTDKSNLLLLLFQPIIIALLVSVIFEELQIGVLFLMSISAIWFGVSNAAKEIVGELAIYKRERMFNLKIHPYILSKWTILSLIALIQTFIFVAILYLKFQLFSDSHIASEIYLKSFIGNFMFMAYLAISASLIGLLLSAHFNTTERVMTVVPIALMPQIMLSGVITKIDNGFVELLSFFTLGRWGTEGLGRIQDGNYERVFIKGSQQLNANSGSILTRTISSNGTSDFTPIFAEDLLNYYPTNAIGKIFDSLPSNCFMILGLTLVMYSLIYFSLKKKDFA